jgi:hypothetical protein
VNGSTWAAWVGALAAVGSAVAAGAAWKASTASNKAASSMVKIETARRHQELTPQFTPRLSWSLHGGTHLHLDLDLDGPIALHRLARLTVRIRDDRPDRGREPLSFGGSTLSGEDIRRQVWGPVRFTPHVGPAPSRADEDGRVVEIHQPLAVGESLRFQLDPTRPPRHLQQDVSVDEEDWVDQVGTDLRLLIVAHPDSGEPWTIPLTLDTSRPPKGDERANGVASG